MSQPAPGGDPGFVDELRDPLAALPRYFGEAEYEPRSLRPVVGPAITVARKGALGLVGRALRVMAERQDRVNRLITRMLEVLDQRSAPQVDARLVAVEEQLRAQQSALQVGELELSALARSLGLADDLAGADLGPIADAFDGATDVLVIGSIALAARLRVPLVDPDAAVVASARGQGISATQLEPEVHVRTLADGALGGVAAAGIAERLAPGRLLVLLRQLKRALRPAGVVAIVVLDAAMLGDGFWLDPRRIRPMPRALLAKMLETVGFVAPAVVELGGGLVAVVARRA